MVPGLWEHLSLLQFASSLVREQPLYTLLLLLSAITSESNSHGNLQYMRTIM